MASETTTQVSKKNAFNPDLQEPSGNGTGAIQTQLVDTTVGDALDTAAGVIDKASGWFDNILKSRQEAQKQQAVYEADQLVSSAVQQFATNPAFDNASKQFNKLAVARDQGVMSQQDFLLNLDASARKLKEQNPTQVQAINEAISKALGADPRNTVVSLMRDQEKERANKLTKIEEEARQLGTLVIGDNGTIDYEATNLQSTTVLSQAATLARAKQQQDLLNARLQAQETSGSITKTQLDIMKSQADQAKKLHEEEMGRALQLSLGSTISESTKKLNAVLEAKGVNSEEFQTTLNEVKSKVLQQKLLSTQYAAQNGLNLSEDVNSNFQALDQVFQNYQSSPDATAKAMTAVTSLNVMQNLSPSVLNLVALSERTGVPFISNSKDLSDELNKMTSNKTAPVDTNTYVQFIKQTPQNVTKTPAQIETSLSMLDRASQSFVETYSGKTLQGESSKSWIISASKGLRDLRSYPAAEKNPAFKEMAKNVSLSLVESIRNIAVDTSTVDVSKYTQWKNNSLTVNQSVFSKAPPAIQKKITSAVTSVNAALDDLKTLSLYNGGEEPDYELIGKYFGGSSK